MWFKKKNQDTPAAGKVDETTGLDFAKYELDQLGVDIRSIVDLPGAIGQAAKYTFSIPFAVAIGVWAVFSSRMADWVLWPFAIVAFFLSFLGAVVIGGYFVARKRLDLVSAASNRVVDVIGEMHADVMLVKDGHAGTSVQGVAVGLLENAIFPAVFGTINATAETAMGPLGRFSAGMTKAPMAMVQKSVISVISSLPDKEIGQIVSDVGEAIPAANAGLAKLQGEYERAREKVEGIVATVSRTTLRSTLGFALVASVPLLTWLVLGWLLS